MGRGDKRRSPKMRRRSRQRKLKRRTKRQIETAKSASGSKKPKK